MEQEQLQYLYGLERFGIKPGLERVERMMEVLGHPEQSFQSIHVAGTNGKGSVVAMLDSILRQTDKKVGRYTSPHIYSFSERITVNGVNISEDDLAECIRAIRMQAETHHIQLTFFEFVTVIAYYYFAQKNVDIAVIEVGMGGLLDATNVITPEVSVITTIGLDHTEFLGSTIELIAREKAGIIKRNVPVIVGSIKGKAREVIEQTAREKDADCIDSKELVHVELLESTLKNQRVQVKGSYEGIVGLPLLGEYQLENLQTVLAVMWMIRMKGYDVLWQQIQQGIAETFWPARIQVVSHNPLIIIDGAHNTDGSGALRKFLMKLSSHPEGVVIVGYKKGKDIEEMVQDIVPLFEQVIISQGAYMPEDPYVIAEIVKKYHRNVEVIPSIFDAVERARTHEASSRRTVITGSLYLAADALQILAP